MKNWMHLCLQLRQGREAEVDRRLRPGAHMFDDRSLADPEGNVSCVMRSAAERASTG